MATTRTSEESLGTSRTKDFQGDWCMDSMYGRNIFIGSEHDCHAQSRPSPLAFVIQVYEQHGVVQAGNFVLDEDVTVG
jgi:hypothetical protein